ncbi:MAG: MFS transporter [Deltaproteobacteria bacterium]|nr:MFS transporter [Deltaproteobacteria bacterium]
MEKPKRASRIEVFSWCMYDFANSSYSTIIVTVAFSMYFTKAVAAGGGGERLWGYGYSLSMLCLAVVSPLLGAIADYGGLKKRFLLWFTAICITATAFLFFAEPGDVYYALIVFAISNIGFNGGVHFYNSFLIDIADKKHMGRISGYGWALGYVGGLISLVMVFPLIKGGYGEENIFNYRLSFLVTAVFFLVASVPTFLFLKERTKRVHAKSIGKVFKEGFERMHATFHEIRKFKELTKYFFCYLLYTDAIDTVIVFSSVFAISVLGFTTGEVIMYFIITQITAAIGAAVFGPILDRFGAKTAINTTLVVWIGISIAAYFVETKTGFYVIGLVAGTVLGANQSSSRALLGLFTPHGKNAEFFGFFSLVGKCAAIIGPIVYGEITAHTGSQRLAVLSLAAFFIAGLVLLRTVNVDNGIKAAEAFETKNPAPTP